jgi:hypothetical protein
MKGSLMTKVFRPSPAYLSAQLVVDTYDTLPPEAQALTSKVTGNTVRLLRGLLADIDGMAARLPEAEFAVLSAELPFRPDLSPAITFALLESAEAHVQELHRKYPEATYVIYARPGAGAWEHLTAESAARLGVA